MKKRSATIDERSDPSEGSNASFRVDRVYPPAPRVRASEPNLPHPSGLERQLVDALRELDDAHAKIAALELRCAMLESEANRHALERLHYIAHLEEGLAMLGACEGEDEPPALSYDEDDDDD
jgi:hypothetical protein